MNRGKIRAFIAIPLPAGVKKRVEAFQRSLKRCDPRVRWVKPDNMHLTLKFLGDIPEQRTAEIAAALNRVVLKLSPFSATIEGAGSFPSKRKPRVLWVGIERGRKELKNLALQVDTSLAALGVTREKRPFSPHITVGRVKSLKNIEKVTAAMEHEWSGGEFPVSTINLMKSRLTPAGARYSCVHTLELEG